MEKNKIIKLIKSKYIETKKENITPKKEYTEIFETSKISIENILKKYINNDEINKDFYLWYCNNQKNIDLKNLLKNKKEYDLIFNKNSLNNLLYDNSFISIDIIQEAERNKIIYEKWVYENIIVDLYYCFDEHINIELIFNIICFLQNLLNKKIQVNVCIYLGKQKKKENKKYGLSPITINSGGTTPELIVYIWRREELYKVLIHELMHYFKVDFNQNDDIYDKLKKIFNKKFDVIGNDAVNESYVEFLANIIHSIIYSYENNVEIEKVYKQELYFSYIQMINIFANYIKVINHKMQIKQNTSVISYYIIKLYFLINYNLILDFIEKNKFNIMNNQNEYIKLYENILNKPNLNREIVKKILEIKNIHDGFSLRMVNLDL